MFQQKCVGRTGGDLSQQLVKQRRCLGDCKREVEVVEMRPTGEGGLLLLGRPQAGQADVDDRLADVLNVEVRPPADREASDVEPRILQTTTDMMTAKLTPMSRHQCGVRA